MLVKYDQDSCAPRLVISDGRSVIQLASTSCGGLVQSRWSKRIIPRAVASPKIAIEASPATLRTRKAFAVPAPALVPTQLMYVMDVVARNAVPFTIYLDISWPIEKIL